MLQALRIAGAIIVVTFVTSARAEDKAKAREAYHAASQHYDLGEYQQALDGFKEAYRNYEEPAFLFNIAQCHRALRHRQEALQFYRSYLRKSSNPPNRAEVEKVVSELQNSIAQGNAAPQPAGAKPAAPASSPPPPATAAAATPRTPTRAATTLATSAPPEKPTRKRTWIWGVVAGVVVVGVAVGLGVGLGTQPHPPKATYGAVSF